MSGRRQVVCAGLRRPASRWLAAVAMLAAALTLAACAPSPPKFLASDITGSSFGHDFSLPDASGKQRSLADFRGKVVVVFFGYTHCPDICPTTLAETAAALKKLGADADRVQVLFVTIDPERDTANALAKYVTAFDPRFLGLRGDAQATSRAAKEFKVFYEKRKTGDSYSMDHSGQTYVIDPQGRLRLLVRPERLGEDLAEDLRTLLRG